MQNILLHHFQYAMIQFFSLLDHEEEFSSFFFNSKMFIHTSLTNPPKPTINGILCFFSLAEITSATIQFQFTFIHFHSSSSRFAIGGSIAYNPMFGTKATFAFCHDHFPSFLVRQYNTGTTSHILLGSRD